MKRLFFYTILLAMLYSANSFAHEVIFGHGFGAAGALHAPLYQMMFPGCNLNHFEFPDSPYRPGNRDLNIKETSLGQDNEIGVFENKYQEVKERIRRQRDAKKIIAGVSRGSMCAANGDFEGADAFFLESPGNLPDIIYNQCSQYGFGWVPFLDTLAHWLVVPLILQRHDPNGPHPIDRIQNIPRETDIFLSYTKEDNLIPPSSTVKLAEKLISTGHNNVYLWGANRGAHSQIINDTEGRDYFKVGRAFVRKVTNQESHNQNDRDGDRMLDAAKIDEDSIDDIRRLRNELEWDELYRYSGRNIFTFALLAAILGFAVKKIVGV